MLYDDKLPETFTGNELSPALHSGQKFTFENDQVLSENYILKIPRKVLFFHLLKKLVSDIPIKYINHTDFTVYLRIYKDNSYRSDYVRYSTFSFLFTGN
jgi:hypothetical protein